MFLAIGLAGCLPDQAKVLDACRQDADRFYHTYEAVDPNHPSSQYIIACMAAKGYDFTALPTDCDSGHPLPTQSACYEANNWLDWSIEKVRHELKPN